MAFLGILACAIAGCGSGVQGALNGDLGKKVGQFESLTLNSFVGLLLIVPLTIIYGTGNIWGVFDAPLIPFLTATLGGAVAILGIIYATPIIGPGTTTVVQAIGQFGFAIVIDALGLFGVNKIAITPGRIIGVVCMIIGLYFIHVVYRKDMAKKAAAKS